MTGTGRAVHDFLFIAAGGVIGISMSVPWWMDDRPLGLVTHWPKAILLAGLLMIGAGIWRLPRLGVSAAVVLFVSLLMFYGRVDNSKYFAEFPFTHHVDTGFLVALGGLALAALATLGVVWTIFSDQPTPARPDDSALLEELARIQGDSRRRSRSHTGR
jgi:hypothetical protein